MHLKTAAAPLKRGAAAVFSAEIFNEARGAISKADAAGLWAKTHYFLIVLSKACCCNRRGALYFPALDFKPQGGGRLLAARRAAGRAQIWARPRRAPLAPAQEPPPALGLTIYAGKLILIHNQHHRRWGVCIFEEIASGGSLFYNGHYSIIKLVLAEFSYAAL